MIHKNENNPLSQEHLEENLKKFNGDCRTVMLLLYTGHKLTARDLEVRYGIDGRRLRDCYAARRDIEKKAWVRDADGKTRYMQYWIEKPKLPTKTAIVQEFNFYKDDSSTGIITKER